MGCEALPIEYYESLAEKGSSSLFFATNKALLTNIYGGGLYQKLKKVSNNAKKIQSVLSDLASGKTLKNYVPGGQQGMTLPTGYGRNAQEYINSKLGKLGDLISYQQLLTAALASDDEGVFGSSLGVASTFVEKMGSAPAAVYGPFLDWYKSAYDSMVNGIGNLNMTFLIMTSKKLSKLFIQFHSKRQLKQEVLENNV
jgi:hypothetical protein